MEMGEDARNGGGEDMLVTAANCGLDQGVGAVL